MSSCTHCGGKGWLWMQSLLTPEDDEKRPCPRCQTQPPKHTRSTALTEAYKRCDALERDVEMLAQWCADKELEIRRLRDEPREIICTRCGRREQQGVVPKANF
jgi:hypothetical protein